MKKKLFFILLLFSCSCGNAPDTAETVKATDAAQVAAPVTAAVPPAKPKIPNLQAEILDPRNKKTESPIGKFDFQNFTFELPRGWQNPDGSTEFTLVNGHVPPAQGRTIVEDMEDEEKAEIRANRRIGMSYVTTKYLDLDGNGEDEAIVITKIETGGSAIPQIVYVFRWNGGQPEMLWTFRTGDRADGGLKDIRYQNGMTVIELYGQDRFILAEETGLIVPIGKTILSQACQAAVRWQKDLERPDLLISVNLSGKQFKNSDLLDQVRAVLQDTGIAPNLLKLEITETIVMENTAGSVGQLKQLKDLGVQISIDDFGTGYSSLSYLHRFPFDIIKIDRSFVGRMTMDRESLGIVKTICALANELGKAVIAEGIEKIEHQTLLKSVGCQYGQGYLYSKPLTAVQSAELLAANRAGLTPGMTPTDSPLLETVDIAQTVYEM